MIRSGLPVGRAVAMMTDALALHEEVPKAARECATVQQWREINGFNSAEDK